MVNLRAMEEKYRKLNSAVQELSSRASCSKAKKQKHFALSSGKVLSKMIS
jgi:CII-binding regulator of phage lambda lysogenization HflD